MESRVFDLEEFGQLMPSAVGDRIEKRNSKLTKRLGVLLEHLSMFQAVSSSLLTDRFL